MLFRHLEMHPLLTCRMRWTPNALVVWTATVKRAFANLVRINDGSPNGDMCCSGWDVSMQQPELAAVAPAALRCGAARGLRRRTTNE
jgi:hypothetical protein